MIPLRGMTLLILKSWLHCQSQQSHAHSVMRCFACKPTANLTFSLRTSGRNGTFVLYGVLQWDFLAGASSRHSGPM